MVGSGVADLPNRAPKTYKFLLEEIERLKYIVNDPSSRKLRLEEHPTVSDETESNAEKNDL